MISSRCSAWNGGPALDPEALKAKYHRLTAEQHPDVTGGDGEAFARDQPGLPGSLRARAAAAAFAGVGSGRAAVRMQGVPADGKRLFSSRWGWPGRPRRRFSRDARRRLGPAGQALLSAEQYQVQEELQETIGDLGARAGTSAGGESGGGCALGGGRGAAVAIAAGALAIAQLPG